MFKLDSSEALLASFRPKDRRSVELGPAAAFPVLVHDYLAWTHPAGGRVFLVFAVPGGAPTGIAFDTRDAGSPPPMQLCHWCHTSSPGVGLLTATVNADRRVGVNLCVDLSCGHKLEEEADRTGRSVRPLMAKLVARMAQFAAEGLGIDLSGRER